MAKLTEKQKRFVSEYLVDLNATQAAIRAGYSARTANEQGARLLANVSVQNAVQEAVEARQERTGAKQDRVVRELEKIAYADRGGLSRVVTVREKEEGSPPVQVVELTDTDDLSEDQRATLAGVEETKFGIKVSTYDKLKALELLGRHLGMFTDKVDQTGETVLRFELGPGMETLAK